MKRIVFLVGFLAVALPATNASAGVWFELLHAPCWTGDDADANNLGEIEGAIDCFNNDFNGDGERTILSIKAFQAWEYGTMFLYYDVTGPFNDPGKNLALNEKAGFFGGTTVTLSAKKIAERIAGRQFDWGVLANLSLKYEIEHVAKFGALHYYGLQWDFAVPFMDFVSATTVIRDDRSLSGIDVQVGAAWQKSFSLGPADFMFGGFFQWGLFGEGTGTQYILVEGPLGEGAGLLAIEAQGRPFFLSQPQLLWDFGKAISFTPAKLYLGFEYQISVNRYLIKDKSENVLQGMIRWNI